jgi:FG-GAP-like repeat
MVCKKHRVSSMALAIALVLVLEMVCKCALGPSLSRAATATTSPTVTLSGERIEQSSAATADFNGDGRKEIVVGGRDGMLYVIAYNGSSWSVVWSRQVLDDLKAAGAPSSCATTNKSDIRSAPAIGDLDNDGHLEVVVSTGGDIANHRNGGVLVYRYNSPWSFSVMPGWPQPKTDGGGEKNDPDGCWDGLWSTPALGDLDGDGDLEVVVEGFDRRIHAWHHNGTYVNSWPIYRYGPDQDNLLRGGWSSPALGDIDGDGLPEVVVGTDSPPWDGHSAPDYTKSTVWAINGDSTNVPGWPITTNQIIHSSPALGDIDGDGQLEVVVGTGSGIAGTGGYKVYAWHGDGTSVSGWPRPTEGNMPAPPALGDLDGDGDLEVVIGCGAEGDAYPPPCSKLYAWHGNGNSLPGFPMSPPSNNGWGTTPNGLPYAPILADYDGDGSVEILVVNRWSWGISTIGSDGSNLNNPSLVTQNTLSSSPVVDNLYGDNKLEIVIGGANSSGTNGAIYIWNMNGSANASNALPWPMFHRDVRRTGSYPVPPRLGFPSEIRLFHQYGVGNSESVYAVVRNQGEGQFDWRITHPITIQVTPSSSIVTTTAPTQFVVDTTGILTGWHTLGTVNITGTASGKDVLGSPITSTVYIYVGDVARLYLPLVLRNY